MILPSRLASSFDKDPAAHKALCDMQERAAPEKKWQIGDAVEIRWQDSLWQGNIIGFYTRKNGVMGACVEDANGNVHVYRLSHLKAAPATAGGTLMLAQIELDKEALKVAMSSSLDRMENGAFDNWSDFLSQGISAYLAARAEKGIVEVPREPTEAMIKAAWKVRIPLVDENSKLAWQAMIAAALPSPTGDAMSDIVKQYVAGVLKDLREMSIPNKYGQVPTRRLCGQAADHIERLTAENAAKDAEIARRNKQIESLAEWLEKRGDEIDQLTRVTADRDALRKAVEPFAEKLFFASVEDMRALKAAYDACADTGSKEIPV